MEGEHLGPHGLGQLLDHEDLLVGQAGRDGHSHRVLAVAGGGGLQALGGPDGGLLVVHLLQLAAALHHGGGEGVLQVGAVEAEAALGAQQALVHRALLVGHRLDEHVRRALQVHGAAQGAEGAGGVGILGLQGHALVQGEPLAQGAGGTHADALAAGNAVGVAQGSLQGGLDHRVKAAVHQPRAPTPIFTFVAHPHAQPTQDTLSGSRGAEGVLVVVVHPVHVHPPGGRA